MIPLYLAVVSICSDHVDCHVALKSSKIRFCAPGLPRRFFFAFYFGFFIVKCEIRFTKKVYKPQHYTFQFYCRNFLKFIKNI